MMKMIQSLFSYRFPLASPAPARPCTLPDAFTHCRKWARVGLPLGTHHNAVRPKSGGTKGQDGEQNGEQVALFATLQSGFHSQNVFDLESLQTDRLETATPGGGFCRAKQAGPGRGDTQPDP